MPNRLLEAVRGKLPARPRELPLEQHRQVLSQAKIERVGELNALYLGGTPYEMGYQHGVLARDLIQAFRRDAYAYTATLIPLPRWLSQPALFYYAANYWKTIPEEYCQELQGIADGAGAHPIEALVATCFWEMLLMAGCSEFAAVAPYTRDGELIHGYNYDLMLPDHALIQPYLAAIFYRPSRGVPFVTVNTLGSVGANAGINAEGISVAWDNTELKDKGLIEGIPSPIVPFIVTLRRLLQYSHNITEAIEIVTGALPRNLADIIIIGSAREVKAVSLETAGRRFAVRPMQDGAIWSTNCFRSAELASYDRLGDWRVTPENENWKLFPRFMAYEQLFNQYKGKLDAQAAVNFLRDPYPREKQGFLHPHIAPRATICRDITSFSMVMQPGKGRLWVADTQIPSPQNAFYAFDLNGWQRLPELDLPGNGYQHALACAVYFLKGELSAAQAELEQAAQIDGESAILTLMQAVLNGRSGDEQKARQVLERVKSRWGETPIGKLAADWLGSTVMGDDPAIPFPSAIKPLFFLKMGNKWAERVGLL
jgi:hypothetical protein